MIQQSLSSHYSCQQQQQQQRQQLRFLPRLVQGVLLLLAAIVVPAYDLIVIPDVDARYVSYEDVNVYKVGDRVPIVMDKLTSPVTFAPIDYSNLPLCMATVTTDSNSDVTTTTTTKMTGSRKWYDAISALHGDAHHPINAISLTFGYDLFCATACTFEEEGLAETDHAVLLQYQKSVRNNYYYNVLIDGLPAAYQSETDETMSVNYWGGIPVGNMPPDFMNENSRYNVSNTAEWDDTTLINNHWNIQIWYRPINNNNDADSYSIVRVVVEPFSVQQVYESGTMASCDPVQATDPIHTSYDVVYDFPVQQLVSNQPFRFTYDVIWMEASEDVPHKKRWDIYLAMDGAIPNYVEFAGFFLGGFILVAITGILITWVLRDLSYKPIIDQQQQDDDEVDETTNDMSSVQNEIQMWPLSNRIFFPPTHARLLLCISCGTGAQLFVTAFFFIVLLRFGIISQSQGARILSPGIVLYSMSSVIGGYITARLYAIFHGDSKVALVASLVTAIAYPLIGLLVAYIVYDILPLTDAPNYDVSSNISHLIILWICFMWPATVVGGYYGFRGGPIQNFPISAGSAGYHDLNLQNDDEKRESEDGTKNRWFKWKAFTAKYRIPILLSTGGFLPILSCFVNYSYGVAGPTLLRYYTVRRYMILSFTIFMVLSGLQSVLIFYRQIRTLPTYDWWWTTFSAAGSAGIYIFALSMSYILFRGDESNLSGYTVVLYMIWFGFTSFGVLLMTGFMGVALNIIFIRTLYTYIMNRQQ